MGLTKRLLIILGTVALVAVACAPTATPTTTSAPRPTATPAPAAPQAQATATATPGAAATTAPTATLAKSSTPAATGPRHGGVLRGYVPWDMQEWDIQREPTAAWPMHYTTNAVFSKLATFEQAREGTCLNPIVPVLAESYKYVDTRTLDVTLRPGVKFHNKPPVNGRELTAQDVAWNFTRLKEVARSGQVTPALLRLDKVEATGPRSVRFYFKEPFVFAVPGLLAAMTGPFMYAPEAGGPNQDFRDPYKTWIGTGPFLFKEWKPGVKVIFARNPGYFRPNQPYVDGLEILVMPDEATRMAALLSGKLDLLWRVSPSVAQFLRKNRPEVQVNGCPYESGFGAIWMRTDKAPWNDVRVRRAMSMAIDRQTMIDTVFLGEGEILTGVPSLYGDYSLAPKDLPPDIRRYIEYHPDEAKKLLAEAGYPNGLTTTLETTRQFGSPFNESIEAMLAMWANIGVKVEPKWYDPGRYFETVRQGKYDNLGWARSSQIGNPFSLPSQHSREPLTNNMSYLSDAEMDKLVERMVAASDEKEQAALARQIQRRLVEQAYVIQQPTPMEYAALQPYVRDFGRMSHMSRAGTLYERVWLDR